MKELDTTLTLWLNGSDNLFLDGVMTTVSTTWIWIPLLVVLLIILMKNCSTRDILIVLGAIALTILCADQFASGLCKPFFMRLRPSQDPAIMHLVDIVDGYRGGLYGFISSHAANTFAVATLIALLARRTSTSIVLFSWAVLTSYSRIYLGVHYLGDVLCGALTGLFWGWLFYQLCIRLHKQTSISKRDTESFTNFSPQDELFFTTTYVVTLTAICFISLFKL